MSFRNKEEDKKNIMMKAAITIFTTSSPVIVTAEILPG
jgi:hypothetical protein